MPIPLILGLVIGICVIGTMRLHLDQPMTAHAFSWAGGFNLALFLHSMGI